MVAVVPGNELTVDAALLGIDPYEGFDRHKDIASTGFGGGLLQFKVKKSTSSASASGVVKLDGADINAYCSSDSDVSSATDVLSNVPGGTTDMTCEVPDQHGETELIFSFATASTSGST